MEELKKCKACNNDVDLQGKVSLGYCFTKFDYAIIVCHHCNKSTKLFLTKKEAIEYWNKEN